MTKYQIEVLNTMRSRGKSPFCYRRRTANLCQYRPFLYAPPPSGRCSSGRVPLVRKTHRAGKGQKSQTVLLRQVPEYLVERPPGKGTA